MPHHAYLHSVPSLFCFIKRSPALCCQRISYFIIKFIKYYIVNIQYIFFTYSSVDGLLGSFHFFTIANNAVLNSNVENSITVNINMEICGKSQVKQEGIASDCKQFGCDSVYCALKQDIALKLLNFGRILERKTMPLLLSELFKVTFIVVMETQIVILRSDLLLPKMLSMAQYQRRQKALSH